MPKAPSHFASSSKTPGSRHSSNNAPSQASHTHPTPYNRPEAPSHNNTSQGNNNSTSHVHAHTHPQEDLEDDDFGDLQLTQEELDDFDVDPVTEDGFGDINDLMLSRADLDAFNYNTVIPAKTTTAPTTVRTATSTTTRPPVTVSTPATKIKTTPGEGAPIPPDGPDGQITTQQSFTAFLERLKSGKERTYTDTTKGQNTYRDLVRIPDQFLFTPQPSQSGPLPNYDQVQLQFLLEIFPDLQSVPVKSETMMSNMIVTERDDVARTYNEKALEIQKQLYTAQAQKGRSVVTHGGGRGKGGGGGGQVIGYHEKTYIAISQPLYTRDYEMQDLVTASWLNPPGMPQHEITLRLGNPVILIKDILGYPAGTRMIITHLDNRYITAEISTGPLKGRSIFLSRIRCTSPNARDIGIMFERIQLPIKCAFAVSLSDAVGLKIPGLVGLDLRSHVSGHRMLSYLMACCADYRNLRVYIEGGEITGQSGKYTRNPV